MHTLVQQFYTSPVHKLAITVSVRCLKFSCYNFLIRNVSVKINEKYVTTLAYMYLVRS